MGGIPFLAPTTALSATSCFGALIYQGACFYSLVGSDCGGRRVCHNSVGAFLSGTIIDKSACSTRLYDRAVAFDSGRRGEDRCGLHAVVGHACTCSRQVSG
jgi:hypothetical protein